MKIDVFCGVGNTFQYCLLTVYAGVVVLSWVFFEGLRMTQWRSKHVALTIYYFEVYEVNCVIDWHICVLYIYIYIYIYIIPFANSRTNLLICYLLYHFRTYAYVQSLYHSLCIDTKHFLTQCRTFTVFVSAFVFERWNEYWQWPVKYFINFSFLHFEIEKNIFITYRLIG